ncbi:hypothetical protein H1D32_12705 [Anaerobacillus sp. CMMVII]|uniref:hypothetical protein n=1 Tax=Anaerobacillus sp. CMMVII TaxID=2755588 RepID=UPI0021B7C563|nr:hypothetical protein [Anaerobacillus sp. CMMVII]MCT8138525.1 hypothetical protein [Anaerobacillus sp. CMMVII]
MRNEDDIFKEVKNSPDFEPRMEFVQETKKNLVQKARKMKFQKNVKKLSIVSSSIAATAIFSVWLSFLGGKQVIFDTVGSLLNENEELEVVDHELELSANVKNAKSFLERRGYEVISYDGSSESYRLTKTNY